MKVTAQRMVEALKEHFGVCSYSGRAMCGVNCLGVDIDSIGTLMGITRALLSAGLDGDEVENLGDSMRLDSMGKGYIVYWPFLTLTAEEHAELEGEHED